jgi:hypothetical protein
VAFAAKGGTELERTTFTEIFLTIGGGIACAIGILFTARSRPRGAITVALFVLLALITALSIDWSIVPGESWIETNRTLAYVAVFGGAVALGNLGPGAAELVLRALLAAATVVVGYALISRVWPAQLAELEIYARIGQPFGYWNAVGVTAAFALPLALALGARRTVSPAVSALAFPVTGLMIIALFLTYSRSALLGALIAVALWLVFVPLRLRSAAVLITAGVGAAPVLLWATSKAAFTDDGVALAVREDVAVRGRVRLHELARADADRARCPPRDRSAPGGRAGRRRSCRRRRSRAERARPRRHGLGPLGGAHGRQRDHRRGPVPARGDGVLT